MAREAERRSLDMFADNLALRSETGEDLGTAFAETELQGQEPVSLELFLSNDIPYMQPVGIGYCKPIVKRQFVADHGIRFRTDISCAEDLLFYVECLIAGARFSFSKTAGYLYTVRPNGHGTAFNLQASRVNRLITGMARDRRPSALPVLRTRQRAIDYVAFQKSLRARRYSEVLTSVRRLPPWMVVRYAAVAAMNRTRRLGIGRHG